MLFKESCFRGVGTVITEDSRKGKGKEGQESIIWFSRQTIVRSEEKSSVTFTF